MSSTPLAAPPLAAPVPTTIPATGGWLFGPWIDLLFVANVAWPLLLIDGAAEGLAGGKPLGFWLV